MATQKIEDGIRSYLSGLGQPVKPVVNRDAVKELKARFRAEADPLERLRLLAAIEVEEAGHLPDRSGEEAVFIAEAKTWADAEGVSASAFQALGVPDDVLRAAGFSIAGSGRKVAAPSGSRSPRVPLEAVKAAAASLGKNWRLGDLAAKIDRDPGTARNYVSKLLAEGTIVEVGEDPNHDGRGRAPKI